MYGLSERDFNDVVLDVGVIDAAESISPANATEHHRRKCCKVKGYRSEVLLNPRPEVSYYLNL
jgi:hypothetical protein